MHYGHASLKRLLIAQLTFIHHLDAVYAQVIRPLALNLDVRRKLYPKSTLAELLRIVSCCGTLNSSFKTILEQNEPETFETDAALCISLFAEYVDILMESIKNWLCFGLPKLYTVWTRQRTDPTVRQALADIGDVDAGWRLIQKKELNWKDKSHRLDIFSTCVLPLYFPSELIERIDQLRLYINQETQAAKLALTSRNKLQALDRYLHYQSNAKEHTRQIRILAVEYLIHDCPSLLGDRLRKYERAASFQLLRGVDAGPSENVLVFAFNDILIWADIDNRLFSGGLYRTDAKITQDPLNENTICLQISSTEVVKIESPEKQQHQEWLQYLGPKADAQGPIQLERRHSLLNKYPAQTLHVEVRLHSKSSNSLAITDDILVRDGDRPSKLAYLFACRHRLNRTLTHELCSRLESVASSRCKDIVARRQLYLGI